MSEKKSSKKRRHEAADAGGGAPAAKFHPGPEFQAMLSHAAVDLSDGSKELWLIQLPKPLTMQGLHGVTLDMESPAADTLGTLSKDGVKFSIVQESSRVAEQLFVVACGASKDSSSADMVMLPLTKRVTLDRVEEGPMPLPTVQDKAAGIKSTPLQHGQGHAQAITQATSTPAELVLGSERKKKKDKKEKKEKKDKESSKRRKSTSDV